MATMTIYPTMDGSIKSLASQGASSTWAHVRTANASYSNQTAATGSSYDSITPEAGDISGYFITRGFFTFAIPSAIIGNIGTITSATLRLSRKYNTPRGYVIASTKASATIISSTDFVNVDFSTPYSADSGGITGTTEISFNAAGISAVQSAIDGYFECAFVENDFDYTNTDPGSNDSYGGIYWSEGGTSTSPMLTLTYDPFYSVNIHGGTLNIQGGSINVP